MNNYTTTFDSLAVIDNNGFIHPPLGIAEEVPCDGRLLHPILRPELFQLLGWDYGRKGFLFRVPDLRARVLVYKS